MTAEEKRERTKRSDPNLDNWEQEELVKYILELESKIKAKDFGFNDCDCQEILDYINKHLSLSQRELERASHKLKSIDIKSLKDIEERATLEEDYSGCRAWHWGVDSLSERLRQRAKQDEPRHTQV